MRPEDSKRVADAIEDIVNDRLYKLTLSKPLVKMEKDCESITKISVHPVMIKDKLVFQETVYQGKKAIHDNYGKNQIVERIVKYLDGQFGQLDAKATNCDLMILTNKKGTVTIKKKKHEELAVTRNLSHNKEKNYILKDGEPADFLVSLGVQMPDGKVAKSRYDKFKQINRYLEFVDDILPSLEKEGLVKIVDFGCGKSYLTFALYYYLKIKKNYNVDIVGLDLKADVIAKCNELKNRLHYTGLKFICGDIKDYVTDEKVDMVVSLHACDTATDYAIKKAIDWNARVIMAVPCCQHQVNKQIKNDDLKDLLKYGIIKERMSALITDAYRAQCLETIGYDTQILEFIDMEHTPKNILIRAVKNDNKKVDKVNYSKLKALNELLSINPLLGELIR